MKDRFLIGLALLIACQSNRATSETNKNAGLDEGCSFDEAAKSDSELFSFNEKTYRKEDLPFEIQDRLFELETEQYEKMTTIYREFALRTDLAQKKKGTGEPLPPLEELLPAVSVADKELKRFYEENKLRLPQHSSFDSIKEQLRRYLESKKKAEQAQEEMKRLATSNKLKVMVAQPIAPKAELVLTGYPAKGSPDLPYTLVEVSDYLCPHCQQVQADVEKALRDYRDQLHFVQLNFSLNLVGPSGTLIRGAYCAQQQGDEKFWRYHEQMFEFQARNNTEHTHAEKADHPHHERDADSLKQMDVIAEKIGLKMDAFKSCVDSQTARDAVAKTNAMLKGIGLRGTPTFYLDGRKLVFGDKSLSEVLAEKLGK